MLLENKVAVVYGLDAKSYRATTKPSRAGTGRAAVS
jgi:hypothetical protein